jgi:hypothetical protein
MILLCLITCIVWRVAWWNNRCVYCCAGSAGVERVVGAGGDVEPDAGDGRRRVTRGARQACGSRLSQALRFRCVVKSTTRMIIH